MATTVWFKRVDSRYAARDYGKVDLVENESVYDFKVRICGINGWDVDESFLHLVSLNSRTAPIWDSEQQDTLLSVSSLFNELGIVSGSWLILYFPPCPYREASSNSSLSNAIDIRALIVQLLSESSAGGGGGSALISAATEAYIRNEVDARIGAVVSRAVATTIADSRLIDSFDPFARSHHSDITSLSSTDSPNSPPLSQSVRRAFKAHVAEFYGLNHPGDPHSLTDMLGKKRVFADVTLAHIWPDSYKNVAEFAREMALPSDFYSEPRNFLLLPKDVHDAFDDGKIGFIPAREQFTLRVFNRVGLADGITALDGSILHLPRECEGRVPYKRILGWFAWLAKGATVVSPQVRAELEASMSASADINGNDSLKVLVGKAHAASLKISL